MTTFSLLALTALSWTGILALPHPKRTSYGSLFNGKHPLRGVEVQGLFNPLQRQI